MSRKRTSATVVRLRDAKLEKNDKNCQGASLTFRLSCHNINVHKWRWHGRILWPLPFPITPMRGRRAGSDNCSERLSHYALCLPLELCPWICQMHSCNLALRKENIPGGGSIVLTSLISFLLHETWHMMMWWTTKDKHHLTNLFHRFSPILWVEFVTWMEKSYHSCQLHRVNPTGPC